MSGRPPVACCAPDCRKIVAEDNAYFFENMPYCSKACFNRFHSYTVPDARGAAAPQDVPLQEG